MGRAGNLVGMTGIRQGLGLRVVPAGTLRRVDDTNELIDEANERHYTRADASLDTFYKPIPPVTAAVTVNTEFSESEVDDRQVSLSRFELFFPERRDFFLQETLLFDFSDLEENGRPFFSRRIGFSDDGEEVGIMAGGKVTGRIGRFKLGILDVVLDEHDDVGQQNVLVVRAAVNFGESTIGAIATNGDPEGGGDNTVVGADSNYRNSDFQGSHTINASAWVQGSFSNPETGSDIDENEVNGSGLAYGASITYPNDRINWALSARSFDDEFSPALGFVNRTDSRDFEGEFRRRWRAPSRACLKRLIRRSRGDW